MESVLGDGKVCQFLEQVDRDLAERVRLGGCQCCGGRLHRADIPRKPRGVPGEALDRWERRESFCCEAEGCRKRHTAPSVRFLGRKVYAGMVVVLVAAMMHGPGARGVGELYEALGIDPRTLRRWRRWWLEAFVRMRFWKGWQGRFMPPVEETKLPLSLVERFGAQQVEGLVALMRFLAPITTDSWEGGFAM
jgi:hypothetical protein